MHADGAGLRLAATDISNHLACRHLTQLDRAVAEGRLAAPAWRDPALVLLQERGFAHERAFLEHLRAEGLEVVEPEERVRQAAGRSARSRPCGPAPARSCRPSWARAAGPGARTSCCAWRSPVIWAPGPTRWRTPSSPRRRARERCSSSACTASCSPELQGRAPVRMHVVKPGPDFPRESFRFDDFGAYYRLVRRRLEEVVAAPPDPSTYPYPVPHCDFCRWWRQCDVRRHADDHLCLVAGIRPLHVGELEAQGVRTLRQFAEAPEPLPRKPARGSPEAFARAHGQARIQLEGRKAGQPRYRFLPVEPERGFSRLPEPDAGRPLLRPRGGPLRRGRRPGVPVRRGLRRQKAGRCGYRATWALDCGTGARGPGGVPGLRHGALGIASGHARLPLLAVRALRGETPDRPARHAGDRGGSPLARRALRGPAGRDAPGPAGQRRELLAEGCWKPCTASSGPWTCAPPGRRCAASPAPSS